MQTSTEALEKLNKIKRLLEDVSCTCSNYTLHTKIKIKEAINEVKTFLEDKLVQQNTKEEKMLYNYECKFHVDNSHC
jgi:hypothetical protein